MMKKNTMGAPAHKAMWRDPVLLLAWTGLAAVAHAQAPADAAPSEAARRAAMGPFRMILQDSAAAPRKPAAAATPTAAASAPKKTAAKAADAPAPSAAAPTTTAALPP